ncbi:MAG: Txe/YoeB family addiction module toxin [Bacteroidetes bacterium]|nr:Txe/YoeB family addiction module toxin [Bacteroidota bacterium]
MKQVLFEASALEDLYFWAKTDLKLLKKIVELLDAIQKNPFEGIGKPEMLKHELKGFWSRRIDNEHRLIYKITDEAIVVIACRYHY